MEIDITTVVIAIIGLLGTIISALIAAAAPHLINLIKSKVSEANFNRLKKYAVSAVEAAEQIITGTKVGAERKKKVEEWLKSLNLTANLDEIEIAIESAVKSMNDKLIEK